eukprot:803447-Prorocentrum_minimum.AAC.1
MCPARGAIAASTARAHPPVRAGGILLLQWVWTSRGSGGIMVNHGPNVVNEAKGVKSGVGGHRGPVVTEAKGVKSGVGGHRGPVAKG